MSLVFSDTSTQKGLVQEYEQECGFELGDVSGSSARLKKFTAQVNIAFDEYVKMAIECGGTWQFDDSNHTDYPIITTDLVAGQRDYTFVTDEQGNLILDIYKVLIAGQDGIYREITPRDVQSQKDTSGFSDGRNTQGVPTQYDKTGNGFFLETIPSYSYTAGLKVYINREASYFTYTDTTKKPGVPGIHHAYFFLKPALVYARRNTLKSFVRIQDAVTKMEADIRYYFGVRSRDEKPAFTPRRDSNK